MTSRAVVLPPSGISRVAPWLPGRGRPVGVRPGTFIISLAGPVDYAGLSAHINRSRKAGTGCYGHVRSRRLPRLLAIRIMVRIRHRPGAAPGIRSGGQMSQPTPDLRRSHRAIRRYEAPVGMAAAVGLLAGAVAAVFSPVMITSTALVVLPASAPSTATAVVIADSDPVLAAALPGLSPATSLGTLRAEVQVKSLTSDILAVSVRGPGRGHRQRGRRELHRLRRFRGQPGRTCVGEMLQPAMSATGTAPLMRLLVGAMLGVASAMLTEVIAALVSRRTTP